jgi:hypothetical protein
MFLRGCSWDAERDLVGRRDQAHRPSWQRRRRWRRAAAAEAEAEARRRRRGGGGAEAETRRRAAAAAADSTIALAREAGSAEWQETGRCRSCSCRNMSLRRILANRRLRARIAPFRFGSADPNGLDSTLNFDFWVRSLQPAIRLGLRLGF